MSGLTANVNSFTLGRWHACVLVTGGRVKCWGSDVAGQLGIGSLVRQSTLANVRAATAPTLLPDYTTGQTGGFFTITGWNFPPGGVIPITVNGITLTTRCRSTRGQLHLLSGHPRRGSGKLYMDCPSDREGVSKSVF